MRFAHLSDLHLCLPPEPRALADTSIVEQMVSDVRRISEVLDFVVLSGDVTRHADQASFGLLQEIFSTLDLPIYMVPGNHDGPAAYYRAVETSKTLSSWNLVNQTISLSDLTMLGIDTCIEGETTGKVHAEALPIVARALEECGSSPLIVVMHHPLIPPGLQDFDDTARLEGAAELLKLLQSAETTPIVLSGHVHRPYQARSKNVSCYVAGSPTNAYTSDLPFGQSPVRFHGLQDFYFVHEISQSGRHVVTPQHVPIIRSQPDV